MSARTISWRSAQLSDPDARIGHGLCIYAEATHRRRNLAAFVEGFAWCCGDDKAVVRFDPHLVPSDKQQFAAFKAAVEARVRAGDVSPSEVVPGYWGIANA